MIEEPQPPEQSAGLPPEPPKPHPVRLVLNDDLRRSRLTVLVRLLLAFPHLIWLNLYTAVAIVVVIVNWFATLIRGRSSERRHRWLTRFLRYWTYVTAYLNLLGNPYPPFHGSEGHYPVDLHVDERQPQRRLVTGFRIVLAIPAAILAWVFSQVMQIVSILGWFVAIVIGRMPRGMENLGTYCLRYQAQTGAYLMLLTDRYPSLAGPAA
ncbi:MAG TPA: DUF4389 domain-containing protein [Gaiellaceae bacterium]|nr:DUF4389 domain-containing protein [Gaiellaceae bacterium]